MLFCLSQRITNRLRQTLNTVICNFEKGVGFLSANIYKQLYDITYENIARSESKFINKEISFLYYCYNNPFSVDVSELLKIEATNEEFIQIVYLALLNRAIDPDGFDSWSVYFDMPQNEFRNNAIYGISNCPETLIAHKRIYNNLPLYYHENDENVKQPGLLLRGAYKVYRHCPKPVKKIFKKTAGRLL